MSDSDTIGLNGALWRSLLTRLDYLNMTYNRRDDVTEREPLDPEIDRLLDRARSADPAEFEAYYSAEKRLMAQLPAEVLETDAALKFGLAERRKLPSATLLKERYTIAETPAMRRAVMFELTDALQYHYVKRMVTRAALSKANYRLNRLAWWLVLPTFILLALLYLVPDISRLVSMMGFGASQEEVSVRSRMEVHEYLSRYHLFAVMWFGLIGAYFSRLILFQQRSHHLDRESLEAEFSYKSLAIRLIIGLVAAIIMYLILKAEMVGGSLFPEWVGFEFVEGQRDIISAGSKGGSLLVGSVPEIQVTGPMDTPSVVAPPVTNGSDALEMGQLEVPGGADTGLASSEIPAPTRESAAILQPPLFKEAARNAVPLISMDFAKLLVWSLLAGFSERLIPDRFAAIEKQALNQNAPPT